MNISKLIEVMAALRDPQSGCPWDLEQDFSTIAPYTVEEAYEVADAIERGDLPGLKDELGDLLLQVVFHARMAEEQGLFAFPDVVRSIVDKMIRRHPHVFEERRLDDASAVLHQWETLKAEERRAGVLDGVALNLPGLTRAAKLGGRAARVGFDWGSPEQVRAKLDEELKELDDARSQGKREEVAAELGDLLFTIGQLARHLELDPESCLRAANARFTARFQRVEQLVAEGPDDWSGLSPQQLEALWQQAKDQLRD